MTDEPALIWTIYEPQSGAVHYVATIRGEDDRIVTEAEAARLADPRQAYRGSGHAARVLADARRIQTPAMVSQDRRHFEVLANAPTLIEGEDWVPLDAVVERLRGCGMDVQLKGMANGLRTPLDQEAQP